MRAGIIEPIIQEQSIEKRLQQGQSLMEIAFGEGPLYHEINRNFSHFVKAEYETIVLGLVDDISNSYGNVTDLKRMEVIMKAIKNLTHDPTNISRYYQGVYLALNLPLIMTNFIVDDSTAEKTLAEYHRGESEEQRLLDREVSVGEAALVANLRSYANKNALYLMQARSNKDITSILKVFGKLEYTQQELYLFHHTCPKEITFWEYVRRFKMVEFVIETLRSGRKLQKRSLAGNPDVFTAYCQSKGVSIPMHLEQGIRAVILYWSTWN